MLLVVGFIVGLTTITFVGLSSFRNSQELKTQTQKLTALLREAQQRSIAGKNGSMWGVRMESNTSTASTFMLFQYPYSATRTEGYNALPSSIRFSSTSVPAGSSTMIWFQQITGVANVSTTIFLEQITGGGTSAVGVTKDSSGLIFFDDFNRSTL
jgi:hypothetical protein